MEYHVSVNGNDLNDGTYDSPFKTISRAAEVARPGDIITVHKGIYREWVNPPRGGDSDDNRIIYQASPDEEVIITGAEIIDSWEKTADAIWKTEIPNSFFGDYNPYQEKIYGDWFDDKGRDHHTGEVYINGKSMFEVESLDKVINPVIWKDAQNPEWSKYTWYCEVDQTTTTIWANFHEYNPRKNIIEINVRPFCFWPEKKGINYITVRGFILKQAATQWAPPTALQTGVIGPHWSKGWRIEDNIISDSKCCGISLGKEKSTGHNEWTRLKCKHGTQREREVIFKALYETGWSRENIGSHIVRNNTIFNCEQAGICGHLGAIFSKITDNHIYNIYTKRLFAGFEIAGIKIHAPIDTIIKRNHIHNACRGIWLDWQAQGTRVTSNLFYDNDEQDLFIEVSHGPYVVDNNIFLSSCNILDLSQGGAFVHNLFTGTLSMESVQNRFTPYHFPHSTQVAGLMTILGGNNRFYNNVFAGRGDEEKNCGGLGAYNDCPAEDEDWYGDCQTVVDYAELKLPVYCASNLYLNGAKPYRKEKNPLVFDDVNPEIELKTEEDGLILKINLEDIKNFNNIKEGLNSRIIKTRKLGKAFQPETHYETPDKKPLIVDKDYFGKERGKTPTPGPFEKIEAMAQKIKVR